MKHTKPYFRIKLDEVGISASQLARMTDTPKDTVWNWSSGRIEAPGIAYFALAAIKSGFRKE